MPAAELSWITIDDFTPGIHDNPGTKYPPGTAQRTNTFRSISYPGGCLGPMPRRVTTYNGVDFIPGAPAVGDYTITGMFTAGPVVPTTGGTTTTDRHHELFLGVEYITGGNRHWKVERIRVGENPVVRDVIKDYFQATSSVVMRAWGMTWGTTRTNKGAPLVAGIPVVVGSWADIDDLTQYTTFTFPNDATPTLNTVYSLPVSSATLIICHQGRIILRNITGYSHGVNGTWSTSEDLAYTDVFNPSVISSVFTVVPELPNGYPCGCAMSANELFLLKESGGVVLSGDIANPTVTNLPMVPGVTDGQTGVRTPLGFLYGNRYSGVWAWAHGDGCKHLSPQLLPDFWTLSPFESEPLLINRYSWESSDNLAFISNNWVLNTDTGGWWRLDDPTLYPIRHFSKQRNFLYGARTTYTPDSLAAVYSWDLTLNATDYSWQSQPIWETIDQLVDVRQITVRIKGTGTVAITVTAEDGTTSTVTFTSANTTPRVFREGIKVQGESLVIKIVSTGTGGNDAPVVYPIQLGYQSVQHRARSGVIS